MKQIKHITNKAKLSFVAIMSFALVGLGLWQYVQAAPNQIYLSPGSASVQNGNNVTVALRVTPGSALDGVEATVTYDAAKLQFVSLDASASPFNISLGQSTGSGTLSLSRGILGSTISSDSIIASITFKAVAGSGTTAINVPAANATSSGSYTNPSTAGATITLTSPATSTPPPATSDPSPSTSTPSTSSPSVTNVTSTPAPSASQPTATAPGETPPPANPTSTEWKSLTKVVEFNKSVISVEGSKNISVYVVFGTDPSQLLAKTAETGLAPNHSIKLADQLIAPGITYYYKVVAKDEGGNVTESAVESFKTKGYTVKLAVKDSTGKSLAKKKFTLHSEPVTGDTDDSGSVTFSDVAPGDHHLEYEEGGKVYSETITIASLPIAEAADGTQSAEAQEVPVVFAQLKSSSGFPVILPITLVLLIIAGLAGAFIYVRRKNQLMFAPSRQPAFVPTATSSAQDKTTEQLVQDAKGVDQPDPGSVVNPKQKL